MGRVNVHDVGDMVRIEWAPVDIAGEPVEPSAVTLLVGPLGGEGTLYEEVDLDDGVYHVDVEATSPGTWRYRWTGTGSFVGSESGGFIVREVEVPAAP